MNRPPEHDVRESDTLQIGGLAAAVRSSQDGDPPIVIETYIAGHQEQWIGAGPG